MAVKANGYVLWEGPSLLDGKPIVMIGTGYTKESANVKTGAMVQTWILRADIPPVEAIRSGEDVSICGDCVLRGRGDGKERGCYVNVYWAPGRVYETYTRAGYPQCGRGDLGEIHRDRLVRLGAYGDPAAVPADVLRAIVGAAATWTGYTHQWRKVNLQALCMASVESEEQAAAARQKGYRTFRTVPGVGDARQGEIICPASAEGGFKTTCEKCRLCDGAHPPAARAGVGAGLDRRKSIAIVVHGAGKRAAREVLR